MCTCIPSLLDFPSPPHPPSHPSVSPQHWTELPVLQQVPTSYLFCIWSYVYWGRKWQPTPSILAWRILWTEEPDGLLSVGSHRIGHDWSNLAYMHTLEKEMATHSSSLAWRIPGTEKPGGLLSVGLHRVGHDWSDLVAVAAVCIYISVPVSWFIPPSFPFPLHVHRSVPKSRSLLLSCK